MRRSRVPWPAYQRCALAHSSRTFTSSPLDLRDEGEAVLVAGLRRRGREAHVLEVLRLLERGDEIGRGVREAVHRETAAAEVERRQIRVGRHDLGELLQEDGR